MFQVGLKDTRKPAAVLAIQTPSVLEQSIGVNSTNDCLARFKKPSLQWIHLHSYSRQPRDHPFKPKGRWLLQGLFWDPIGIVWKAGFRNQGFIPTSVVSSGISPFCWVSLWEALNCITVDSTSHSPSMTADHFPHLRGDEQHGWEIPAKKRHRKADKADDCCEPLCRHHAPWPRLN